MRKIIPVLTAAILIALATGPAYPKGNPTVNEIKSNLSDIAEMLPRFVFVTSVGHNGNFSTEAGAKDGLDGADIFCQGRADVATAAIPLGTYKAWLSTADVDARDRIGSTFFEYFLPDGAVVVAENTDDLLDNSLDNAINTDEFGNPANASVWTGSAADGTNTGNNCVGWETLLGNGTKGGSANAGITWTSDGTSSCTAVKRLYCFQVLGGD